MTALVRSEMLKLRTTNLWWTLLIGVVTFTGLALAFNLLQTNAILDDPTVAEEVGGNQGALFGNQAYLASNVYTSGQYFGLLLALILGSLIVTNEFFHQTATATFLTTPRRANVITAKIVTAVAWGVVFAAVTTVLSVVVGALFFRGKGVDTLLGDGDVLKAILLNCLAFAVWAVFGLGIGTLLKSQIAAVIVTLALYLIGQTAVQIVLLVLDNQLNWHWALKLQYYLPAGASSVMTSAAKLAPDAPAWWGGTLILLAYGAVAAVLGSAITVRRDIS